MPCFGCFTAVIGQWVNQHFRNNLCPYHQGTEYLKFQLVLSIYLCEPLAHSWSQAPECWWAEWSADCLVLFLVQCQARLNMKPLSLLKLFVVFSHISFVSCTRQSMCPDVLSNVEVPLKLLWWCRLEFEVFSSLMAKTEVVLKVLVYSSFYHLMRLLAWESFIVCVYM
jgi:hypothetical protein